VTSHSTPVVDAGGRTWGLVQFETPINSLPVAAVHDAPAAGTSAVLVDQRTGRILLDSGRRLVRDTGRPARPGPTLAPGLLAVLDRDKHHPTTVDGRRVVTTQVEAGPDNANSWSVLVSAPASSAGWAGGIGPAPVAAALAALLLLAFAGLNLRASHNEMRQASLYDELTGLPNRGCSATGCSRRCSSAAGAAAAAPVLLIDLDRFKEVNDTLGHHYGDLHAPRGRGATQAVVRSSDTVARLGGDEFAVLLTEVDGARGAHALAERCLVELHSAVRHRGRDAEHRGQHRTGPGPAGRLGRRRRAAGG
jgi:diguanylate cyclase (GGDEF)-like protein